MLNKKVLNMSLEELAKINLRYGTRFEGVTSERDLMIARCRIIARPFPDCPGYGVMHKLLHAINPNVLSAKYSLFMFGIEEKHPVLYSHLSSFLPTHFDSR